MDLQTLNFLARYNAIVNAKMNSSIVTLSAAEWAQAFTGYFGSVKALCDHVYTCDVNWLKRFSLLRPFTFPSGTDIPQGLGFSQPNIGDVADYLEKRAWLDGKIGEFAAELTEADLARDLAYVDSHGKEYRRNFGLLALHMFNHETHHRGMISVCLEGLHRENDFSNIYDLV
jgi:uncharacterized damage-inducible protein DinB